MGDECRDRVAHLLKCFYPDLVKAGIKIDLLSVATDSETAAPLTLHGYRCAAVVRVVGVKERVKGAGDAEITFDEATYLQMDDAARDALCDHELHHIELKMDTKTGMVKLDSRGRPKIGMKKHDYQFGWFREIAQRHGIASLEVKQATQLFLAEKQTLFDFAMGESTRLALDAATSTAKE